MRELFSQFLVPSRCQTRILGIAVPSACGPHWVGLESLGGVEGLRRSGLSLLVSLSAALSLSQPLSYQGVRGESSFEEQPGDILGALEVQRGQ